MRRAASTVLVLLVLLVLALAACSARTSERQVMVTTRMSVDGLTCGCQTPDDCMLDCGGAVGLFAIDPYAVGGDKILDQYCIPFAPSADDTLRMLSTHLAGANFTFPEGTTLAMEVIVYPGSEEGCPLVAFSEATGWDPTPAGQIVRYAGRSAAQTLTGDEVTFELPIGCPAFFPECPSSTHKLQSYVRNLSKLELLGSSEAQAFDVHAAQLFYTGGTPIEAALTPIADLALQSSPDALFEATSETGFGFTTDCIGTIVTRIPGPSVSTASCEGSFGETQILAQSYYVEQHHIDDILAFLGVSTLPPNGLLVGRITKNGLPDNTFTIAPESGSAVVSYFEEDVNGHLLNRQAGSWFVVSQAELEPYDQMGTAHCCDFFDATNDRGDVFTTWARVGLIDGVVTSTEIATFGPGL